MARYIILLFIFFIQNAFGQSYVFKIRKVPQLKYFVFTDGYNNHNLDDKTKSEIDFTSRMYLQVYDNDTFLIRWCDWKLSDAAINLDYLIRDSLTYAGKITRQGDDGMKFSFPFEGDVFNMFLMNEEALVQKKEYKIGPPNDRVEMIKYYFEYNKKQVVLADLKKEDVANNPQIDEALKLSNRIKLGFYSNDLYSSDKSSADLPLNIINTYPVNFILAHSKTCESKLFWNGVTTNKTLNVNDTSEIRKNREFIENMPEDILINMNGNEIEYWLNRRYVFLENDSQIYITNINRGCDFVNDSISKLAQIPTANYWDSRDGVSNYLLPIDNKHWAWTSKYSCTVEWKIYDEKAIRKLFSLHSKILFKKLLDIEPINTTLLNETCY